MTDQQAIGLGHSEANAGKALSAVEKFFSPEFRNRLDQMVRFDAPESVMSLIVDKCVDESICSCAHVACVQLTDAAARVRKAWLDAAYGARPMARLIDEKIRKRLADELLFGSLTSGGTVKVDLKDGEPVLSFSKAQTPTPLPAAT